jgi:hypothetical protein
MAGPMIRFFISRKTPADWILFPAFFSCVLFWVKPSHLYNYPIFFRHIAIETYAPWFITGAPPYPGKMTDLIASFVAPLLASAWAGSAVLTIIAFVMCWLLGSFLAKTGAHNVLDLKFIPALLMLLELGLVVNPLPAAVSMMIGLALVCLYQVFGRLAAWQRCVLFAVLSAAVYAAAVQSLFTFAVLCIVFEVSVRRKYLPAAIEAVMAGLVPLVISGFFFTLISPADAYGYLVPDLPKNRSVTELLPFIFWTIPILVAAIAALRGLIGRAAVLLKWKIPGTATITGHSTFRGMLTSVLAALFFAGAVWICRGALWRARPAVAIQYAMLTRNWDLLLDEAGKVPNRFLTAYEIHAVNRALYHKGRLLEDLYKVPQNQNSLLPFPFTKSSIPTDAFQDFVWGGPTWFELGLVNIAEHCALEAVTQCYYPQGMVLLSKIYFVKDMPGAGRTCLAALQKDIWLRQWAKTYTDSIGPGPAVSLTPELQDIRRISLKSEFILGGTPPLAALVRENPRNRMAFEYLIAYFLMTRNVDSLANYAGIFHDLKYPKIPLLVEEALLLSGAFGENKPELSGYSPSQEASASFSKFYDVFFTMHGGNPEQAFNDMVQSCGYSYFFYYTYGFSKANINDKK